MLSRWMLCLGLTLAAPLAAFAQETPPTTPPAAGGGSAPTTEEVVAKLVEWRDIITKMRELQFEWKSADQDRRTAIEKEFNDLLAKGDTLLPSIQKMAAANYQADPKKNADPSGKFLFEVAQMAYARDQYDKALESLQVLINGDYADKRVLEFAGISAMNLGEFDQAETYFTKADQTGALSDTGKNYQLRLAEAKADWESEKAIREKEDAAGDLPRVRLKTDKGDVVIELFEHEAPNTVANFLSLVRKKFYDGTPFHRVLPNFMAQGGDPKGDGTGGPGYRIEDECDNANFRKHFRGSLSMAKEEAPDTGGSQFFITFVPTFHLDGKHTVFGRVVEGMDVVTSLRRRDPQKENPPTPDKIITATVERESKQKVEPKTLPE